MSETDRSLPVSEHFVLQNLAPGVWAAVARPSGAAVSNSGIVDLGDRTLIFDTFLSVAAAADLLAAARSLTGRDPAFALLSHSHPDHWIGSAALAPETVIISTAGARAEMPAASARFREMRGEVAPAGPPASALRMPDLAIEGDLTFHGSERTAEFRSRGKGHTACDAILVLPAEKIVFLGDLGFFRIQPYAGIGYPRDWRERLTELEASEHRVFVPGHGPVGTKEDLALTREYLAALGELIERGLAEGRTADDMLRLPVPPALEAWRQKDRDRFERNLRGLIERSAAWA